MQTIPSFNSQIASLYESIIRRNNDDCIMEEIKNNNENIIHNYDELVAYIDENLAYLSNQYPVSTLSDSELVSLNKVTELKSKIIARRALAKERVESHENYRISDRNRLDASSYTAFSQAFKPKPKYDPSADMLLKSQLAEKLPLIVDTAGNGGMQLSPDNNTNNLNNNNDNNNNKTNNNSPVSPQYVSTPQLESPTNMLAYRALPMPPNSAEPRSRKSLEISRPPKVQPDRVSRSRSPHLCQDTKQSSIEMTVNQAAVLAWDLKQKQPNGHAVKSTSARTLHHSQQQQQQKRKYDYVRPTVNTQINLTPVQPRLKSPQLAYNKKLTSHNQQKKEKPALVSANNASSSGKNAGLGIKTTETIKYRDPRIAKVMENLQGVDRNSCEQILDDILITGEKLKWDDIAGLSAAKKSLKETVVYPFLRPDLFRGLREPITGMLLFGPPGTGKTMIAKTVANESNSTFFSISASSLLSKYLGESEKLIRALFYLSKKLSPSIIFFDEIDSLLSARNDNENESSRRVKTEFLIQWSSLSSATANESDNARVLVLAATNLPWAIDEAARRRFTRRLYIPLPEFETRLSQLHKLLKNSNHSLNDADFVIIANLTEGYSNSDITSLAKEAAMEPIRDLGDTLMNINSREIRGVELYDFEKAMDSIKSSVDKETLLRFDQWARKFGSAGG